MIYFSYLFDIFRPNIDNINNLFFNIHLRICSSLLQRGLPFSALFIGFWKEGLCAVKIEIPLICNFGPYTINWLDSSSGSRIVWVNHYTTSVFLSVGGWKPWCQTRRKLFSSPAIFSWYQFSLPVIVPKLKTTFDPNFLPQSGQKCVRSLELKNHIFLHNVMKSCSYFFTTFGTPSVLVWPLISQTFSLKIKTVKCYLLN